MKGTIRKIKKSRRFSEDFKKALVQEFESGKFSVLELSKLHGIANQVLYNWIYNYSNCNKRGTRVVEMNQSSSDKIKKLNARLKEAERMLGQKQIQIEYLERMIELAKDHFDIDIKKNFDTPQSSGSKNIHKN